MKGKSFSLFGGVNEREILLTVNGRMEERREREKNLLQVQIKKGLHYT